MVRSRNLRPGARCAASATESRSACRYGFHSKIIASEKPHHRTLVLRHLQIDGRLAADLALTVADSIDIESKFVTDPDSHKPGTGR
jgi:hypothetical protein